MRNQPKHPFSLKYADEHACVSRIEALRWPDGPVCYKCGHRGGNPVKGTPRMYRCGNPECRSFFSITGETPFAYSKQNLPVMFALLERIAIEGDDLVLLPLTKELNLCWSTLHKLVTRLRKALKNEDPILTALRDEAWDANIDTSDIPEQGEAFFARAKRRDFRA